MTQPTMQDLFRARAEDDRPGIVTRRSTWTWRQVIEQCQVRAAWATAARVPDQPNNVGVMLENTPEFVFLLGAAALSGTTVVGLNPTRRGEDLARDVRHTQCRAVLTDRVHAKLFEGLDLGGVPVLSVDDPRWTRSLVEFGDLEAPPAAVPADAPFMLIFTSGTTGAPKAVICSQGKIARQGSGLAASLGLGPDDVAYVSMPLFHSNAIIAGLTPAVASGATLALAPRFSASGFLEDLRAFGATYANYVGKPLSYVLAQPERDDDALIPLRVVFGNEAAPQDIVRFGERFGCRVIDGFGSTEGGVSISRTPDTPASSLGRVVGDVAVIHLDSGEVCPPAQFDGAGRLLNADRAIGELVNRGGVGSFEGYWGNDEATAQRVRDGSYHSGDLAYVDAAGFVYHAGRTGDWVRVDGENVAVAAIQRLLSRHPDVIDVAVYAVPDEAAGDQIMAALVVRDPAEFAVDGFAAWLSAQADLSPKWIPRYLRMTAALPMTETNKVLSRQLTLEGWRCEDPVWWRRGQQTRFVRLAEHDLTDLAQRFASHGRADRLPVGV